METPRRTVSDGFYRLVDEHQPIDTAQDLTFTYDLLGHMTAQTDANGVATTFEYDKDYRLTLETIAADSQKATVAYSYDGNGNDTGESRCDRRRHHLFARL